MKLDDIQREIAGIGQRYRVDVEKDGLCQALTRIACLLEAALATVEADSAALKRAARNLDKCIAKTNEAAPQTDEACGGCGSGRRLMTSFW
jgi:hypothetical protein